MSDVEAGRPAFNPKAPWLLPVLALAGLVCWGTWNHGWLTGARAEGPAATIRQAIGVDALEAALGDRAPTGRGVTAAHVEGREGDYAPNLNAPTFEGITASLRSGPSKVNGHAQYTSRAIYGPSGLAPGIRDVCFYTMEHWQRTAVLRVGSPLPPRTDGRRLFSHSWVGGWGAGVGEALRRVDYLVDHDDVMMVVGVNNGAETPVPALLCSAYNAIAVGVASGDSSGGYTHYEGAGRCKPDVVAPGRRTSYATPVVAAVVARLLEAADGLATAKDAGRSEVIKAVLMAGAQKPRGWKRGGSSRPLDEHLGAGIVRVDRSYEALAAGPSAPGSRIGHAGWAFRSVGPRAAEHYLLELDRPVRDLSIMLVWNRRIDGRVVEDLLTNQEKWLDTPRLANFDLKLVLLGNNDQPHDVLISNSSVDNVEHVYIPYLPAGRYQFEVVRRDGLREVWDYAAAWWMQEAVFDNGAQGSAEQQALR